jgi:hypothetical protein
MVRFNQHFPSVDFERVNMEIEKSIDLIDKNVYINGLSLVLLNRLQSYVRR